MHARTGPPQLKRRLAFDRGRLAPPPAMDHRWGKQPTESVNQFQRFFLSELILHYTRAVSDTETRPIRCLPAYEIGFRHVINAARLMATHSFANIVRS